MTDSDNTLPPEPPERYVLDKLTPEQLAGIFTWAQITIDAQMDDESADDMQDVMSEVAERLGLEYYDTKTRIEELEPEQEGSRTFKIRVDVEKTPPKPALVWTNDQPDKKGLKIVDKDYQEPSNDDNEPDPPKKA